MPIEGQYEPSSWNWVSKQVDEIESSGGTKGLTLRGKPVIVVTMRGHRSGKVRKAALMKVEHDGSYALVASKGGDPNHPGWYHNLVADPDVSLQDGTVVQDMRVREVDGDERAEWWDRAVEAWPDYADYQTKTDRQIPVFLAEPVG